MLTVLKVLVIMSLVATVGVMFAGMLGLAKSEPGAGERSNRLMRWRVGLQFTTVMLFMLLLALSRG
ncbi:twin transmembrane helix small protein [Falsiroseomonas sp. HW251]|uniref:twin transmembrane helix small protein n=1 Tax=Falsiroseomonas sp. HW251 TaxID=3390998 RepID=UPI003D3149B6